MRSGLGDAPGHRRPQTHLAEFFAAGSLDLEHAVREQQHGVTGRELMGCRFVGEFRNQSEGRPGTVSGLAALDTAAHPPQVQRGRMARVGQPHLAARCIRHQIDGGHEDEVADLFQQPLQLVVQAAEKCAGIAGHRLLVAEQSAQESGDQCRAYAMAHHVAEEHARQRIGNGEDGEEITRHLVAGNPPVGKPQPAGLRPRARRKYRIALRQQCLLHLARHGQVRLQLRVVVAELKRGFRQLGLQPVALQGPGDRAAERKGIHPRLCQVILGAALHGLDRHLLAAGSGQHDDDRPPLLRQFVHGGQQREAVVVRQLVIKQNQLVAAAPELFAGGCSGGHGGHGAGADVTQIAQ